MITVALPKGALLQDSIRLLQTVGWIACSEPATPDSRTQRQSESSASKGTRCACVRGIWSSQLGIVGYDVLREKSIKSLSVWALSASIAGASPYRSTLELPPPRSGCF